jgi:hypothetical protein
MFELFVFVLFLFGFSVSESSVNLPTSSYQICATNPSIYQNWFECCTLSSATPFFKCSLDAKSKIQSTVSLIVFSQGYEFSFENADPTGDVFFVHLRGSQSLSDSGFLFGGRFRDHIGTTNFTLVKQ